MVLPIDYSDLVTLFLFIFAVVGILRGWYKEAITSIFAALLAVLVWQPAIAREIVNTINDFIKLLVMFFRSGFSLDPGRLVSQTVPPDVLLDPDSYRLYIVVTVVLLTVSYVVGETTFHDRHTPLGRLLGGLLGAFNGWVILSLIKQYLLNYLRARGQFAAASNQLGITVTQVPTGNFFAGAGIIFILIVVIGVFALLVAGDRMKLPLK